MADPGLADDNISSMVVSSTFDGLTRKGPDGKFHEAAAEKIVTSEDGLTYTFHLRDANWSNGDPVTARDFDFAWKRALDPQTASDYAYQLFYIQKGAAGPNMSFVKNGSYWDKDNVKLDKIEVTMIDDQNTELSMFENDELDWAGGPFSTLPTDAIPALKDSGKLQVIPVANTYWYQFNIEQPPFNNAKIRKAFGCIWTQWMQAITRSPAEAGSGFQRPGELH